MTRPPRRSAVTTMGLALVLIGTIPSCRESRTEPLVALELESMENTRDGCTACGCQTRGELLPGAEQAWWVSFGLVDSNAQGSWQALGGPSHCGTGSFEEVASGEASAGRTAIERVRLGFQLERHDRLAARLVAPQRGQDQDDHGPQERLLARSEQFARFCQTPLRSAVTTS